MSASKNTKPIAKRREEGDRLVRCLLLVPTALIMLIFVILPLWMVFSSSPTIDTLARSAPLLISGGMIIGLLGFLAGLMLLWFQVHSETAFELKLWVAELRVNTKGVGIISMALGVILAVFSLNVITRVFYEEKPRGVTPANPGVIDPAKVTETDEPALPSGEPSVVIDAPQEDGDNR